MTLQSTTQNALNVALASPQAAADIVSNINTPTPGATTITSATATAFVAGANGGTNPVFVVDASTALVATGLKVKGAAAGSGVAESVQSSGVNESFTLDAKGNGTITFNGVGGTGAVQIGGAASGANATGLIVTPNSAGSGVAIAVVSTGAAENITLDAKSTGTVTLGNTSTGLVILGRGANKGIVESLLKTTINAQNGTPTAAQLLGGYIDHNSQTGAGTLTFPTSANIDAAISGVTTGDSFMCTYVNRGNQTVTLTANGDATQTLRGTVAVPTLKNATLVFVRTGSATYDVLITLSA